MKTQIEDRPRVKIQTDPNSLRNLLRRNGRKFFTVAFIKRTTGIKRVMNCHTLESRKGYDPNKASFRVNLRDKNLFPVIDTKVGIIKTIPLDTLLEVRMEGKVYILNQPSLATY